MKYFPYEKSIHAYENCGTNIHFGRQQTRTECLNSYGQASVCVLFFVSFFIRFALLWQHVMRIRYDDENLKKLLFTGWKSYYPISNCCIFFNGLWFAWSCKGHHAYWEACPISFFLSFFCKLKIIQMMILVWWRAEIRSNSHRNIFKSTGRK